MTKNYATPHSEHPLHTELEFLKLCSIKKKKKKGKKRVRILSLSLINVHPLAPFPSSTTRRSAVVQK